MIHGILFKSTKYSHQDGIVDGRHPVLNIAPAHKKIITWSNNDCWLAQAVDKDQNVSIEKLEHLLIITWARIDNRDEIADKLNLSRQDLKPLSDAQLILRAYLHFGEECTQHLFGDFCFAIYDQQSKKIFCVRDQMGPKPFYYYNDDHVFVFSSSLAIFHKLNCLEVRPSMEWASKYLIGLSMDFHKTAYDQIYKLPPAEQLSVTFTQFFKRVYFSFHTQKLELNSSEAYVELYRSMLEQAVKNRVQTNHPLGSEISGGLDSSSVTAFAAKNYNLPLNNFHTFGFATFSEEPRRILQVNQQYKILNTFISCDYSAEQFNYERALQALGAPVEHSNATGHEIFYHTAEKHKVKTLLSGFGGDEFVTSLHGDLYLYDLLKNKKLQKLYNHVKGNCLTRALRVAKLYYYSDSNYGKVSTRMRAAYDSYWPNNIAADELIHAYDLKSSYEKEGDFDNGYHCMDKFTLEKRWVPFVATRMENCTLMAASYGIDYRWPLLDSRLIQCFLSIPSQEKIYRGVGRYLHHRAVVDVLPKEYHFQSAKVGGKPIHEQFASLPTLNQDLHTDLQPLLNIPKLTGLITSFTQSKSKESRSMIIDNIYQINQLDDWLKYYFPTGCHWAQTPDSLRGES